MNDTINKFKWLATAIVTITILVIAVIKIFIFDRALIAKQIENDKEELAYMINYLYDKEIQKIHTGLSKTIDFFAKDENIIMSYKKKSIQKNNQYHIMLKQMIPYLKYIDIYDKNYNILYSTRKIKFDKKQNIFILKQALIRNDTNEISYVLKQSPLNEGILLIHAMKMQKGNFIEKIIEIAVDISYVQNNILEYKDKLKNMTFDLSLWDNKQGHDDLLKKNIQILNYKPNKKQNLRIFLMPIILISIISLLINFIFLYFKRLFIKEEEDLTNALNNVSSLIVLFTKDRIVRCNKDFVHTLDFKNDKELISLHKYVSDFFVPQDKFEISNMRDVFWADYIIENKKNTFYELYLKNKYGRSIDIFDVSVNIYPENNDKEKYYMASFRNASIRYNDRQNLYLEKSRNQRILENSKDGVIDWNTNTGHIYISKRLKKILGYDEDDIPDEMKVWLTLLHPDNKDNFSQDIQHCIRDTNYISKNEVRLRHKNEKWIWVFARITAIVGEHGDIIRIILFFTDINNQKKQEKIMEKKISEAIKENKKQHTLLSHQSKLASMGEMIGAIAHQWRQPLNELGIKVQSLKFQYKKGLIDESFINDFVSQNKETIMFMSKTIDDFRGFFKADKEKKDFSILEAINFTINMQSAQLKNNNISINITGDDFTHKGIESEYEQVMLNLISNTKDAFANNNIENKTIDIFIKNKIIRFADNAGGIPENIISRIFEPYFTTKEQGQGTGIGLHMSKSIIENSSGVLSVENINDGACFVIDFS